MAEFIPYSEKQKVLMPEMWEEHRFLNADCHTSRVAAKIMRAVVERLLKIDKSGKIDIDDFEFLVSDNESPNAGFIPQNFVRRGQNPVKIVQNGKHVIMITTGLIDLCNTEDEFAGILAHELGHFTYEQIYGDNRNTYFQERFSDIHAADLLIAGGYDPVAYSRVCAKFMQKGHQGDAFGVHGTHFARKEDYDTYLTKLRTNHGEFKVLPPTGLYDNFVQVMSEHGDKYVSYFQQALEHKFHLKQAESKPKLKDLLNFVISEMSNQRLNSRLRIREMLDYINNYGVIDKPEIKATQEFIEQLVSLYSKDTVLQQYLYKYDIGDLCNIMKKNFRGGKNFKIFPPVTQYIDDINELVTTRDKARAKKLIDELYDPIDWVFFMHDLKKIFGKPNGFAMPSKQSALGKTIPTDWLFSQEWDNNTSAKLRSVIETIGFDANYEWATDKGIERWVDKYKGKIVATNQKQIRKLENAARRKEKYNEDHNSFTRFIGIITVLYDFNNGKISATDAVNALLEYGYEDISGIIYGVRHAISLVDYKNENQFLPSEIEVLKHSEAFAELCIKPFLQMLKQLFHDIPYIQRYENITNPKNTEEKIIKLAGKLSKDFYHVRADHYKKLEKKINLDNPPKGQTWFDYLVDIGKLLNIRFDDVPFGRNFIDSLKNTIVGGVNSMAVNKGLKQLPDTLDLNWNVSAGPIISFASGINTGEIDAIFSKLLSAAFDEKCITRYQVAEAYFTELKNPSSHTYTINNVKDKYILECIKLWEEDKIKQIESNIIEQYSNYANKSQWIYHNYSPILDVLDTEIKTNGDMHMVRRLLNEFGMIAGNEQELIQILSRPVKYWDPKREKTYSLDCSLKRYALIYYMRSDLPIKDLYSVLWCIHNDDISTFDYDFTDELSDYIEKHHLMPNDFQSRYDLYALMDRLDVFSKEKSDQSKLLDLMIGQVEKMSDADKEKYAYVLLSGFYYPDDSEKAQFCNRKSKNMEYPLAKKRLMEIYSDMIAQRLGRDDNSDEYLEKIKDFIQFIDEKHLYGKYKGWDNRSALNKPDLGDLYRLISDKIQSQERVSKLLASDKNIALSDKDLQDNELFGRGVEVLLGELEHNSELAINTVEFLNIKLSKQSIENFRHKSADAISKSLRLAEVIKPSTLENLYNTFWSSGLEVRAVIMNKLLNRSFNTLAEKTKYVCDINFSKTDKYRKDAEMIFDCVINAFEEYRQGLILAAVASANKNREDGKESTRSIGEALCMFFETMGPAWVKFGQLVSYVPDLPSEIRRDLGKLKDAADIPARWDLYSDMKDALPNELYNRIERVEDIIGAGSFWVTAVVQFKNDDGKTEKKVLQLLRPYADERAQDGFDVIERAIDNLTKRDHRYKQLKNVAHQAKESAKYEVDPYVGKKQYEKAKELYGDIRINIDGTTYVPNVADWCYSGTGKNKIGYKIMDYAPGKTLGKVDVSLDERRKMALAYFTIELTNLFKGDVWDIDRHQGQQNFEKVSQNRVDINIYDTGAQLPNPPDKKNKILLASIFFGLIKSVQSGKSLESYIMKTIKRLDKLQNKLKIDVSYVSNIQKGLMALSDIIEYQKELKDENGKIIQERKLLSEEDLKNAIVAVLQNPTVDKYLRVVIAGRMVANKLTHLEIQELKKLATGHAFEGDNPVRIDIIENTSESKAVSYNKAQSEIDARENPDDYIMGIPKANLKQEKPDDETVMDALKQLGMDL